MAPDGVCPRVNLRSFEVDDHEIELAEDIGRDICVAQFHTFRRKAVSTPPVRGRGQGIDLAIDSANTGRSQLGGSICQDA